MARSKSLATADQPTATDPPRASLSLAGQGRKLRPRPITAEYVESLKLYAKVMYDGGLTPKGAASPNSIAVLIEIGRDVGLPATMAVAWIAIINGRPSIYGDAAMALIRSSGLLESTRDWYEGKEGTDDYTACFEVKRVGAAEPRVSRFSYGEARRAKLLGKAGPWTEYPERQLMWRAKGFGCRDEFQDVLCGLIFAEEARDLPRVVVAQEGAEVDAAPPAAPPSVSLTPGPLPVVMPTAPTENEPERPATATREQLAELDRLKRLFVAREGFRNGTTEALNTWDHYVKEVTGQPVKAVKHMSIAAAVAMIDAIGAKVDPAGYGVTPAPAPTPAPPPAADATQYDAPALPTSPIEPEPAPSPPVILPEDAVRVEITEVQLEEILRLRGMLLTGKGLEDGTEEAKAAWAEFVFVNTCNAPRSVRSVKHLTAPQADAFMVKIGQQLDPFTYPRKAAG